VFLLPIENGLRERGNYDDAIRRWWKVPATMHKVPGALAVGLVRGVSQKVYSIDHWRPANGKHEFVGDLLEGHELEDCSWRAVIAAAIGYWTRGNYLIVDLNGKNQFRFVRGSQDKKTWHSLT
jgi:hypothetical protein